MCSATVQKSRKFSGFTLIELLVVIAIIAILAAILFPVFETAREKARTTTCASNEKQLGIAFAQYEQDFDEMTPDANEVSSASGGWNPWGWAGQLYPYVKSTGAYACPDDKAAQPNVSYVANADIMRYSITKLNAAASTVLLFECFGAYGYNSPDSPYLQQAVYDYSQSDDGDQSYIDLNQWGGGTRTAGDLGQCVGGEMGWGVQSPAAAHGIGSNFLAADGHVKFLAPEKVSPGVPATNSTDKGACPQSNPKILWFWNVNAYDGEAAGTASMQETSSAPGNGKQFVLTFSPT